MPEMTYIYAMIGGQACSEVLRLMVDGRPLPGGDCPTTSAVGTLVVASSQIDDAGHTVLIALDSAPTAGEVSEALGEGWERPPVGDPWISMVNDLNGVDAESDFPTIPNEGERV